MKNLILFASVLVSFSFAKASSSSMPDLPYNKSVKVGDCFKPSRGNFSIIIKVLEILPKEKKYKAEMLVETERGQFYAHPMGNYPWSDKKNAWDVWKKIKCPITK